MAKKCNVEVEMKSPAEAVWNAIKDYNFLFPKALPEIFESIEILEGDGRSVGTHRSVIYKGVGGTTFKSRLESMDEENKTVEYRLTEGELLKHCKYFYDSMTVKPKDEGCVLLWSIMYEGINDDSLTLDKLGEAATFQYKKLDAYLVGKNKN